MANRKDDDERSDDQIRVRLTSAQKAVLTAAAKRSALNVSAWLRTIGMERAAALGITEETMRPAPEAPVPAKVSKPRAAKR